MEKKAIRAGIAADLLIVEDNPAQRFEPIVFAARQKFSRALGEIEQDGAGLAELLAAVNEHRRFAHLVDGRAIRRAARLAVEEVDEYRGPVGADEIEHQRRPIGIARLREAIKLVFGHGNPSWRFRRAAFGKSI